MRNLFQFGIFAAFAGMAAGQAPTIGGCSVFPADNIWNTRVDQLAVHASSSTWVTTIGATAHMHPDFGSGLYQGAPIGIPFVTVPGSQTKYPATFQYQSDSDTGPYAVPLNAPIEGGSSSSGDRHVIAIDVDHCILYEIYAGYPQTASWQGGSGAIFNLLSNALRTATFTSADAAGLPIFPGLLRYDEIVAGEIRHAIRFTVPQTQDTFIWPARHEASSLTAAKYPPMGARFRLKQSFDISSYSATNQIILTALKRYGMLLADNGSSWYISGAPDARWDNDDLHVLNNIAGSNFEAVDESTLMLDPNTAQARQTSVSVSVTPRSASVAVNVQQQFSAAVTGNSNQSVTWDVNGVIGGNATLGFIDSISGLYTAPAALPSPATVTVHATSAAVSSAIGSAPVTVTLPPVMPATVSVSPNSGTGTAQTFAFTFSDANGATDISSAMLDINASLAATSACYLYYVRSSSAIYLANDAGAWQGPITLGSAKTLQNSQCTVNAAASSASASGNNLTLNLALTFKAAFSGAKNVYMEVRTSAMDSGWSMKGTWTAGSAAPPPDFSIGMSAGPGTVAVGASPTYTVTVTGANGFSGVVSLGVSGLPSGVTGGFNPATVTGSGSSTLTISTTGAAPSGFTITVTGTSGALQHSASTSLTITGSGLELGPTSVSPNSGTGLSQTFAFAFNDPSGAADIASAQMDINASLAVANACYLFYVRGPNAVYLASDSGVWQGPVILGGSGTLQNSQCLVSAAGSSVSSSGNTLTLNLALAFKSGFAGSKHLYMEVQNASHDSGWSQQGTWTVGSGGSVSSPPAPVSVTPNLGSGESHSFAFAFSDGNGATDIVSAQMDINATLSVPNACYLYYVRAANAIYLASNTGVWQGPLIIGSAGTLQNSQCSVNSGTSSVTAVGNTLTVNLALTFKAAFTGSKNIYMEVRDGTHDSGWSLEGSWIP